MVCLNAWNLRQCDAGGSLSSVGDQLSKYN